ncbi:MAG: hypothetical protein JWM21_859 [Acidobacteria bacterium]|nr:hypothetical protein [Acidobacteriota bacterium]
MSSSTRPLCAFLCHSSADKDRVRELYERLRADGFAPWLDEKNLLPGQDWEQKIRDAVRSSDVVIVCLSRGSINKAGFVQKEIKLALDAADEQPEDTIFIIPIKLEECNMPERLRRWQWVNLFEENGYERLVSSLQHRSQSLGIGKGVVNINDGRPTLLSQQHEVARPATIKSALSLLRRSWLITGFALALLIVFAVVLRNNHNSNNEGQAERKPVTAQLFGYVRDLNDQPLQGATVSLDDFPEIQAVQTASNGGFVLKGIPADRQEKVRVRVVKEGYHPNPCVRNMEVGQGAQIVTLTTHQKQSQLPC